MGKAWRVGVLLVALACLLGAPVAVSADTVNVLANGSLEGTYTLGVAEGWSAFNSGGQATYTSSDDTAAALVYDGERSQLLEISTKDLTASEDDRFLGIYQVANVVSGSSYMFSLYGLLRSSETAEPESNYAVQVGFDPAGGTDPAAVTAWTDLPWAQSSPEAPGEIQSYAAGVSATSDKLTVFVRLLKKVGTTGQTGQLNLDAISLLGLAPSAAEATAEPTTDATTAPTAEGTPLATAEATPSATVEPTASVVPEAAAAPTASAEVAAGTTETTLPDTGSGAALPILGIAAALVMLGLAGVRLSSQRRLR